MPYTPNNNPYVPGDPYAYDLKYFLDKIRTTESTAAAANTAASNAVNTANSAANVAANAQNAATNAVNTANNALAIANPLSVIPQLSVQFNFNTNKVRWYKQPSWDEITTFADLDNYLSLYTDGSYTTAVVPSLTRVTVISYPRINAYDMCHVFNAQICTNANPSAAKASVTFNVVTTAGNVYQIVTTIDGTAFDTFAYNDFQIN